MRDAGLQPCLGDPAGRPPLHLVRLEHSEPSPPLLRRLQLLPSHCSVYSLAAAEVDAQAPLQLNIDHAQRPPQTPRRRAAAARAFG
eukprot:6815833-Pyramimonas_sp.AAC.1